MLLERSGSIATNSHRVCLPALAGGDRIGLRDFSKLVSFVFLNGRADNSRSGGEARSPRAVATSGGDFEEVNDEHTGTKGCDKVAPAPL